ncbi:MAG: hypothetical protein OEO20_07965 [Gemmatimonadota bacterium]|nr:hypothetical protein [Gemmatimonadota bacterium]MDH3366756.1 hypothetical protein [Gemmatimonadota bacterium]MDH3478225.1 hypothetical protein [Gemmatimonadota bacterium]MDH3568688.1 hypothetical protein [Gemmatimonadota bacterium]MDH5549022.1 hypothetical protein [Gemmatimonadota bacterium]
MLVRTATSIGALLLVGILAACNDAAAPSGDPTLQAQPADFPPPSPLVTVAGESVWPFTGSDFAGTTVDPINLAFTGWSDPRDLRAALLMLDGDRSVFAGHPQLGPFAGIDCTWKDAMGDAQTAYGATSGWVGSAIQLECGDFDPLRVHLRFFNIGDVTLGGAHFEVLIPGTTDHQVVSWEFAEGLVVADFIRAAIGGPVGSSGPINPVPYRSIPAMIYNSLPDELKFLILASGGVPDWPVPGDVGIGTDGAATVVHLAAAVDGMPEIARQRVEIQFNQVIPKPFCASGPYDFLDVNGPVTLRQHVVVTPSGAYHSQFHAVGMLTLQPLTVDLSTGGLVPSGAPYRAHVNEHVKGILTDRVTLASQFVLRAEMPRKGPFRGSLRSTLNVAPGGGSHSSLTVRCDP